MRYNVIDMALRIIKVLSLLFLLVITSWALLNPNFFYVHDYLHTARIAEMARGLSDFHFPVRWSQNFGYGYGMPLFEFYAPLPYFVGAIFYLHGFEVVSAMQIVFIITNIVSIGGAYLLGREIFEQKSNKNGSLAVLSGIIVATVFSLAPYRAVNLFVRGALSEAWGMMFFPLILLFGIRFIKKNSWFSWLGLTLSISGLFLSHNLSALMFLPLSVIFILGYLFLIVSKKKLRKDKIVSIARIFASYLAGFALSAFYVLPAYLEKSLTKVESTVTGGYFDFKLHFVGIKQFFDTSFGYGGSGWDANDSISFFIGLGAIFGIVLMAVSMAVNMRKNKGFGGRIWFLLTVFLLGLFSLFMTHNKSLAVWEVVFPLKFIQFPWRWLSSVSIFFAICSAGFIWLLPNQKIKTLLAGIIILVSSISALIYFKPESFLENSDQYYFVDAKRIQNELSPILPDYLPKSFSSEIDTPNELLTWLDDPDSGNVNIIQNKVNTKAVAIESSSSAKLTFAVADFPGWKAFISRENKSERVEHQTSDQGLIKLDVPPGPNLVTLEFVSTPVRKFADYISGLSLFGLVIATIIAVRKRHESE